MAVILPVAHLVQVHAIGFATAIGDRVMHPWLNVLLQYGTTFFDVPIEVQEDLVE